MSGDVLLIEPVDKNASVPPILKMMYDFISKCTPVISEKRLKKCNIDAKDIFKYQSGVIVDYPRWVVRTGLLSIAAYLEKYGYHVDYCPLNYYYAKDSQQASKSEEEWLKSILKKHVSSDKVVGITCTTPEFKGALRVLKICKEINPNIVTVMGGYHVTFQDLNTLQNKFVDIVVRGEGEETMLEITKNYEKGKDFSSIKGITYRSADDKVIKNPGRPPLDLKSLPIPAYHLLPKDALKSIRVAIMLSRGCPYNCSFCVEGRFWKHKIRYRSINQVINELRYIKDKFKLNFVHLADSSCDLHYEKINKLCNYLIKNDVDIFLSCNIRADSYRILGKIYDKMKKAGFIEFLLGVESGSDIQLQRLNKGITFNDVLTTLKVLNEKHIPFIRSYWMIGGPGENHQTATETVKKLDYLYEKELIYDSLVRIFTPYPGLDIFDNPSMYGITILTYDWDRYRRFSFPPVHRLVDLNEYELCNYIFLMKSIQIKHYAKWAGMEKECYDFFWNFSEKYFWKVIPP